MKRKIWKNKKGDEMLLDFVAIVVLAGIIMLFFFLFAHDRNENERNVQEQFLAKDANFMLESFLRAPALSEDIPPGKTVGEIIIEDSINGNFDKSEKLFKAFFKEMQFTQIVLKIDGPNNKIIIKNDHDNSVEYSEAETYLPGYTEKIYVKLSVTKTSFVSFT